MATEGQFPKGNGDIVYPSEINTFNYGRLIETVGFNSIDQKKYWMELGSIAYYHQPDLSYTETIGSNTGDNSTILTNTGSTTCLFISGPTGQRYRTGMNIYDLNNNSSRDSTRWRSGNGTFSTWSEDTSAQMIQHYSNSAVSGVLFASGTNQYNYRQTGSTVARFRLGMFANADDVLNTRTAEVRFGVTDGATFVVLGSRYATATNNNGLSFSNDDSWWEIIFDPTANTATVKDDDTTIATTSIAGISAGPWLLYFYTFAYSTGGATRTTGSLYGTYYNYNTSGLMETSQLITTSGNNIKGVYIVPRYDLKYSPGTSEAVDVSINGGTTYAITNKSLGSYIDTSTQTGSCLRLKFVMTGSSTNRMNYSEINDYFVQAYI